MSRFVACETSASPISVTLTVDSLAKGIERVVSHAPYATTAEAIAAKMMKEPGADEAATRILAAASTNERERSEKKRRTAADVTL